MELAHERNVGDFGTTSDVLACQRLWAKFRKSQIPVCFSPIAKFPARVVPYCISLKISLVG